MVDQIQPVQSPKEEIRSNDSHLDLCDLKYRDTELWICTAEKEQPPGDERLMFEKDEDDAYGRQSLLTNHKIFIDNLIEFKLTEFANLQLLTNRISGRDDPKVLVRIKYFEHLKNRLENLVRYNELRFHRSVSVFREEDDQLMELLSKEGLLETFSRIDKTLAPHSVLFNDVVLLNIFSYLNIQTIKHCRLVCAKWRDIGTPLLKSQVIISFTNMKPERTPADWNSSGNCSNFAGIEFSSFKFKGFALWGFPLFKDFIVGASMFINELTLEGIVFNQGKSYDVDITSLLENHNLKSLHLRRSLLQQGDRLSVSLEKLHSVQYLTLQCCTVLLNTKSPRIVPKELELAYVRFIQDENLAAAILVNQFVDFSSIEKLNLCDTVDNSLVIDLSEEINATCLKLSKTLITDWENARWTVDQLTMGHIHVRERTLMKIKELELLLCKVCLSMLPITIEKLSLEEVEIIRLSLLRVMPVNLPKMKYLEITRSDLQDLSYLKYFSNCPSLTELRLTSTRKRNLDLRLLPQLIRVITVYNVRFVGDTDRKFDLVRLLNCHLGHVKYYVTNFEHTETLVVEASQDIHVYENDGHYDEYNVVNLMDNKHFTSMILGKFFWNNQFFHSPICQFFDCEANYYLIQNVKASAISDAEFRKYLV